MKEELIRIEYKLDLVIRALQDQKLMLSSLPGLIGIGEDSCPICEKRIVIKPDFKAERLRYICGCSLPQPLVTGISSLLTPTEEKKDGSSRITGDAEVFQSTKDSDSDS